MAAASAASAALGDSVLERTNGLLKRLGVTDRPFVSVEELQENASSTVVAIFEALFITRIAGVRRRPADPADYAWNAGLVIEALQVLLPPKIGFPHDTVTGTVVASGDLAALDYLITLLQDIHAVIATHGAGAAGGAAAAMVGQGQQQGGGAGAAPSQDASFATETTATTAAGNESMEQQQHQVQEQHSANGNDIDDDGNAAAALAQPDATEGYGRPATAPHGQARSRPVAGASSSAGAAAGAPLSATIGGRGKKPGATAAAAAVAVQPPRVPVPAPVPAAVKAAIGASPKPKPIQAQSHPQQRPTSAVGGGRGAAVAGGRGGTTKPSSFSASSGNSSTVSRSNTSAYTGTTAGHNNSAAVPHQQQRVAPPPVPVHAAKGGLQREVQARAMEMRQGQQPQLQATTGGGQRATVAHLSVAASHGIAAAKHLTAQLDATQRKLNNAAAGPSVGSATKSLGNSMARSHSASATVKEHRRLGLPVPGFSNAAMQGVAATTSKTASDLATAMGGHPFFGHSVPSAASASASAASSVVGSSGIHAHAGLAVSAVSTSAKKSQQPATHRSRSSGLSRSSRGSRMAPMSARFGINPSAGFLKKIVKKEAPGLQETIGGLPAFPGLEPPALTPAAAAMYQQQQQQQQQQHQQHQHSAMAPAALAATAPAPPQAQAALPPGALRSTTARLAQQQANDVAHIATLHQAAVKSRLAEYARLEASAVRSATLRARAAKHERKVLAARTKRLLEDMARHTLSLRLARSSKQAATATALLKAYAAQLRAEAADRIRFAAADRQRMLADQRGSLEAAAQAISAAAEVAREETVKQMVQRQAALRSQRETLARALAEMRADEEALLQAIKTEQSHAEAAFLAQHVEGLNPAWARGASMGDFDAGAAVVSSSNAAQKQHHHQSAGGAPAGADPHLDNHTLRGLAHVVSKGTEDTGTRITSMGRVLSLAAAENRDAVFRANEMAHEAGPVHALLVTRANEKAAQMAALGKSIAARTGAAGSLPQSPLQQHKQQQHHQHHQHSGSRMQQQHHQHHDDDSSYRHQRREDEEAGVVEDTSDTPRSHNSRHQHQHISPQQQQQQQQLRRHYQQPPQPRDENEDDGDDDDGSLDDGASGSFSEAAAAAVAAHERELASAARGANNGGRPLAARPEHHRAQQRKMQEEAQQQAMMRTGSSGSGSDIHDDDDEDDDAEDFVHHQEEDEDGVNDDEGDLIAADDNETDDGAPGVEVDGLVVTGEQMPLYDSPQAAQASSPRASSKTRVVDAEEVVVAEAGAAASHAPLAIEGRGMAGVTLRFEGNDETNNTNEEEQEEGEDLVSEGGEGNNEGDVMEEH